MELWDLLDQNRNLLRRLHKRGIPLPDKTYHAVVFVWVVNREGKFLLTRRSPEKKAYPNCWGCTGGAVKAGESSRQAVSRELWEETGIRAQPESFTFLCTIRERDMFCDIYFLSLQQWPITIILQPGETVQADWFTMQRLRKLAQTGNLAQPDAQRLELLGEDLNKKARFFADSQKKQE